MKRKHTEPHYPNKKTKYPNKKKWPTTQQNRPNKIPKNIPVVCAPEQFVRLRYNEQVNTGIQTAATPFNGTSYNVNGLYDFNATAGADPIAGYANWMSFYHYYKVVSIRYKLTFVNSYSSALFAGIIFTQPATTFAGTFPSWSTIMHSAENPFCQQVLLAQSGTTGASQTIERAVAMKTLYGDPKTYMSDVTLQGTVAANPSATLPMYIYIANTGNANITATVYYQLQVDFFVKFFTRNVLNA